MQPYWQLWENTTSVPTSGVIENLYDKPRLQYCSVAIQETGSELQLESDNSVFSHQPSGEKQLWGTGWQWGNVSIGRRFITNFRFADDIVVNAKEEEEAGVMVDRLNTTAPK